MQFVKCFVCASLAAAALAAQALPVVATVDGKDLTKADIDAIKSIAPPDWNQMYQTNPIAALSTWFVIQELGKQAEERELDQRSPLKEQLEFRRRDMLAREMVNVEQNTYAVTPEMIDDYYQAHRELYEETKIKGILIRFKPANITQGTTAENIAQAAQEAFGQANNDRSEADALALAKKVVDEIRGGADFLEMVNKYSEDRSSKEKGGELPTIRIDSTLPQDFRQAIVALKAGEVSEPIRQPTGFYIVRVEERTLQPVADVRGEIIDAIRREHRDAWLTDINQRFRVDIKDRNYFQPQAPAGFSALPGQQ